MLFSVRGLTLFWSKFYLKNVIQCVEVNSVDDNNSQSIIYLNTNIIKLLFYRVESWPHHYLFNNLPNLINHPCVLFVRNLTIVVTSYKIHLKEYEKDMNVTLEYVMAS